MSFPDRNIKIKLEEEGKAGEINARAQESIRAIVNKEELKELIGGGGGGDNAVLYTPQSLSDEQKAQALSNIGGAGKDYVDGLVGDVENSLASLNDGEGV